MSAILNVAEDGFDETVIEASRTLPVLVDFWAEWCRPCHMLTPVLEQLAAEYADRLRIARVNADENPSLASEYGIRSLPTVKLLRYGEVVDEFSGVQPLAALKSFVAPHLPRESDSQVDHAATLASGGRREEAITLLRRAVETDPGNHRIHPELIRLLIEDGSYDEAESILNALPANIQQQDEMRKLHARLGFARIAQGAPGMDELKKKMENDPDDLEARYQLGACLVLDENYAEAMEHLIGIIQRDRGFRDDGGRRALLDVFTLLDNEGDLVKKYRRLLASAIN